MSKTIDYEKIPGHWLLASLGKTVLRPGGLNLTKKMLDQLNITKDDHVVEFAPGLGVTARLTLQHDPHYTAIEQNEDAANKVRSYLTGSRQQCHIGTAEKTGLPDNSATIVYGEAMLTMQSAKQKQQIIAEAKRILKPGGKYAIHEMCLAPENIDNALKESIQKDLSVAIRVNARPLTIAEWKQVLEEEGFIVTEVKTAPMHLLRPKRMIQDEGLPGVIKIASKVICNPKARKRVLKMRAQFTKYEQYIQGVTMVAQLPEK